MTAPAVVLCMIRDVLADVTRAVVEETPKDLVEGLRLVTTADLVEDIDLEIAEEMAEDLADESSLDKLIVFSRASLGSFSAGAVTSGSAISFVPTVTSGILIEES